MVLLLRYCEFPAMMSSGRSDFACGGRRLNAVKTITFIAAAAFLTGPLYALEYEKDIMPIFTKKCAECHSDSAKVRGGFKVDDPKHFAARLDKNNIVVPGDWDASYLFVTLFRPAGDKDAMPPEGKGERLTPKETAMVQLWIAEGATIDGKTGEKGYMPKEGELGFVASVGGGKMDEKENGLPERAKPREWANNEGKTIMATLLRVEGGDALLKLANGQVYRYPIANLAEESQAALLEQD